MPDQVASKRVLLVEDNDTDAHLISQLLRASRGPDGTRYEVVWSNSIDSGLTALRDGAYDALLLDLHFPGTGGVSTFSRFVAYADSVPIIALTGLDDEALAYSLLDEGAQDYLLKDNINRWSLVHAIEFARNRHRIQKQLLHYLEAHSESGRDFRTMVEATPVGLIVLDGVDRVQFANEAACRLLSLRLDNLVGMTLTPENHEEAGPTVTIPHTGVAVQVVATPIQWSGAEATLITMPAAAEN